MKQSYDGLHRIKNATYKEGTSVNNHYTEKVTEYDRNGNITTLQRYGRNGASSWGVVDNPTLTRTGNQLTSVSDSGTVRLYDPALGRWLSQDPMADTC